MKKILLGLFLTFSTAHAISVNSPQNYDKEFQGAKAPKNYIINSGGEINENDTDGSVVTTSDPSLVLEGKRSFEIAAASSGEPFSWVGVPFDRALFGRTCEASFVYRGNGSNFKAYATLNDVKVSAEVQLVNPSQTQPVSIIFPCGSSTTDTPKVVIESTATAPAIRVDNVYIGEAVSIGSVAQAVAIVRASRNANQSIGSTAATVVAFDSETLDAFGEMNTSTGVFTSKNSQTLNIYTSALIESYTSDEEHILAVRKNGTTVCRRSTSASNTFLGNNVGCQVSVVVGDTIDVTTDSGSDASYQVTGGAAITYLEIIKIPSSSEIVVRSDAPGSDWTAFTPTVTHGSGSATNVTHAGWYRCNGGDLELKYQSTFSNTSAAFSVWYYGLPTNFAALTTVNNDNLGFARFDDAGTAAFGGVVRIDTSTRLLVQYQAISTHTGTAPLLANQNISNTLPFTWTTSDSFTAYARVPVTASSPCPKNAQPLIPGSVFSSSLGVERIERAKVATVCSSSPCTITSQSGGFSSIVFNSTGNYTANFVSGTFSAAPTCQIQTNYLASGSFRNAIITTSPTTSSFTFITFVTTTAGAENSGFEIICMGPR